MQSERKREGRCGGVSAENAYLGLTAGEYRQMFPRYARLQPDFRSIDKRTKKENIILPCTISYFVFFSIYLFFIVFL